MRQMPDQLLDLTPYELEAAKQAAQLAEQSLARGGMFGG